MKKPKRTPTPIVVKALSFNEMMDEVINGAKKAETKWQNDHLCTAQGCKTPSVHDLSVGTHLCDKCKKEMDKALKSLRGGTGFVEGRIGY